ncbi:TPA: hypothetical protein MHP96_14555 [Klebsiella quasipneumoniae subsp. similipneumoniae]|nr:hypothetical protein [Klebsiella quasipneumoniae subsp. similipneumoniae]HBX1660183.1 hypothetical protein [Klebsiella quasipneumoniae subsp. similipneumoniae]HBX1718305.1 hypothetical protein [Klebsiella quasipneumoniae subsp. similipneumoniae]HBX1725408.1 hypothetical protein [Klebsiella quasipneumoniae subsp. similipneumoniae]HBX1729233.1 hypothetical protein [Klebsiella quasipneumoniae subsp. similipneumoniae]
MTATGRSRSNIRRQIPGSRRKRLSRATVQRGSPGRIRRQPPSATTTGTRPDCPAALRLPGLRRGRTQRQITQAG